jgi:hypothetical protein
VIGQQRKPVEQFGSASDQSCDIDAGRLALGPKLDVNIHKLLEGGIFMSPLCGLRVKQAVQREIWVPTQHLL